MQVCIGVHTHMLHIHVCATYVYVQHMCMHSAYTYVAHTRMLHIRTHAHLRTYVCTYINISMHVYIESPQQNVRWNEAAKAASTLIPKKNKKIMS